MDKKVVLVVMDGVGKSTTGLGDAVTMANTPTLDKLMAECPHTYIKAHGTAVGLPSDEDMGNSEVGHNALGCGQIYSQGAKLVEEAIESGAIFASAAWKELSAGCVKNASTMHFIGLLSDGNVHSNIHHLIALIAGAKRDGIKTVRVHVLLDGRDVPATSALVYVDMLEEGDEGALRCLLRRAHSLRRRQDEDHHGPLFRGLGYGEARLFHARLRRGQTVRERDGRHRHLPRREPRHHRSGSARVRHRGGRQARGRHARRRQRGAVQLPRRPCHRAQHGVRRRRFQGL